MKPGHAILVCGHAIYIAPDFSHRGRCLVLGQIRRGIELASGDPSSVLVYTGGMTRGDAGPSSEGMCGKHCVARRSLSTGSAGTLYAAGETLMAES